MNAANDNEIFTPAEIARFDRYWIISNIIYTGVSYEEAEAELNVRKMRATFVPAIAEDLAKQREIASYHVAAVLAAVEDDLERMTIQRDARRAREAKKVA
jgi:hypothetical protein